MKNKSSQLMTNFFLEGVHYSTTVGNSMYPLLRNRQDRIIVKPLSKKVRLLDVVFYQRPTGKIILHRVIWMDQTYFYICGDNQYRIEKVPKQWIVGVLVGFYRGRQYVSSSNLGYRMYAIIWWILFPLRMIFLKSKNQLSKRVLKKYEGK